MISVNDKNKKEKIVVDPNNVIGSTEQFKPVNEEEILNKQATENLQIPLDIFLNKKKELEPVFTIRLPSIGKAGYEEIVKLKPLYTKHQKIIAKTPYFSRLPVYIDILRDRVETSKGFPVDILRLTKDDFNFILALYQISLSPTIDFIVTCGKCEFENNISINIENDLEMNSLDVPDIYLSEIIYNNVKVTLEIPRVDHLLSIYEYLMKSPKQLTQSEMRLHELAFCLKEVFLQEEQTIIAFQNVEEKIRFINELEVDEALKLEALFERFSHGINPKYNFVCSKCGHTEEIDLPLETEFDFFQLNEVEKLESILETQFLLAKTAGIDLSDSDLLDPTTRNLLLKIVNDFYQKIDEARRQVK